MPALSWALRPPEIFDLRRTPSNVGAIPEYFRSREGTTRSLHPTHSVCAVGRRTHELLGDHRLDCTPCGAHSPFHKILETSGKIVMLGCGLGANTAMHALEEYVEPPYLYGATCRYTLRDAEANAWEKDYRTHGFAGFAQRYDRVADLEDVSFLRRGQVLQAATIVLDAPRLKIAVLRELEQAPLFFVQAQAK
jgi:aminoglycoside 3-N-acetyltransferase